MGAAGLAPANSLAAIEAALRVGVDLVELDVWSTQDNHLVLGHFDWIRPVMAGASLQEGSSGAHDAVARGQHWLRTTSAWHRWPRISRTTLAELQALANPPVLLEEALDLLRGRAVPYLDLRDSRMTERLCTLVRAKAPDGVILSAGPHRSFQAELALLPEAQATSGFAIPLFGRALSAESIAAVTRASIRRARRMGASGLSVEYHLVRPPLVEICREEDFFVFAWTVDDPATMRRLASLGVDGITSNRPDLFHF